MAKRQKPSSRSPPIKTKSGIFPRRPSGSKFRTKTTEMPLFVPDEEDDVIPQATGESEGDEWEDFDEELEEDVQISIAIAESLELQRQSRRISNTRAPVKTPVLETPVKIPRQTGMDNHNKIVTSDKDEFASPSRLETQLSIAGARKPLSTRVPSDTIRKTATVVTSIPPVSPKSTQSLIATPLLDRPPVSIGEGNTGDNVESDEDDDMEEISIPQATENRLYGPGVESALEPPKPLVNTDPAPVTEPVETPLAIGVEDAVAKGFAEFQKIFAEKRKTLRAENPEVEEERWQTREALRAESPGLEYIDDEVEVTGVQERGREPIEVRSSPPQSDRDEDMEEVEVVAAPPPVPSHVPQSSVESGMNLQLPPPSTLTIRETHPPEHVENNVGEEDEEDVPISDWSRSPSPRPRPPADRTEFSISAPTLDRARGLLDPDDSFDQGPSGEQDQEHEDFDAAHEMDPDAETGEFARWMSQVKGRDLDDVRKEIEQEINGLRKEQKAAMRDSEDITGQMVAQIMVSLGHQSHLLSLSFWIWI